MIAKLENGNQRTRRDHSKVNAVVQWRAPPTLSSARHLGGYNEPTLSIWLDDLHSY